MARYAQGTNLVLIGDTVSPPDDTDWYSTETWTFFLNPDEFIYVVAWDDFGGHSARMLIADFETPGALLVTGADRLHWQSLEIPTGWPSPYGGAVNLADVMSAISNGGWTTPGIELARGTDLLWEAVQGIHPSAKFIWHDSFAAMSKYVVFRAAPPGQVFPDDLLPPSCENDLAAAQAQIETLTAALAQKQLQIDALDAALQTLVKEIQHHFQQVFANPGFVLLGSGPLEQLQNLFAAVMSVERGTLLQIYKFLNGWS